MSELVSYFIGLIVLLFIFSGPKKPKHRGSSRTPNFYQRIKYKETGDKRYLKDPHYRGY